MLATPIVMTSDIEISEIEADTPESPDVHGHVPHSRRVAVWSGKGSLGHIGLGDVDRIYHPGFGSVPSGQPNFVWTGDCISGQTEEYLA